jgi:hypothetical protein
LGFFDIAQLRQLDERGVFWITRIQCHTVLSDGQGKRLDLRRLLRGGAQSVDRAIRIGRENPLACRLIARQVPGHVVRRRRRRLRKDAARRGRAVSQQQLVWCQWTVVVTNLPPAQLTAHEALVLLKMRWQIELLFKRWKSLGQVHESRSTNPWRVLVEIYAKLLGMLIQHWLLLATAWKYEDRSLSKASVAIGDHALLLIEPLATGRRLATVIKRIADMLIVVARLQRRRGRPPSYWILKNPEMIDSTLT